MDGGAGFGDGMGGFADMLRTLIEKMIISRSCGRSLEAGR